MHDEVPWAGPIGFGCTALMTSLSTRPSTRLLEVAYDLGVRHFDVAPAYGFGDAETCLGAFLKSKPDASIATKYGVPRGKSSIGVRLFRVAPGAAKVAGWARSKASLSIDAKKGPRQLPPFSPQAARRELDLSRRALKRDQIDLWLLHEADVDRPGLDEMIDFLHGQVANGSIRRFGVGTSRAAAHRVYRRYPELARVVQTDWSINNDRIELPGASISADRIIAGSMPFLRESRNEGVRRQRSSGISTLTDKDLVVLALRGARMAAGAQMLLFSSKRVEHIEAVVEAVNHPFDAAIVRALVNEAHELVRG